MEAARGQKHPSEAEKVMKMLNYWKKCFKNVAQRPKKSLSGSNQILATTSDKSDIEVNIPVTFIIRDHSIGAYTQHYPRIDITSSTTKTEGLDF
jgi:hypothetical protein